MLTHVVQCLVVQVQDVPGLVERLLGFLDIGKDFVTAETIVQVKDLARKYPDIAEVCVGSVSNISLEVGPSPRPLSLPPSHLFSLPCHPRHPLHLLCWHYKHANHITMSAPVGERCWAIAGKKLDCRRQSLHDCEMCVNASRVFVCL